MAADRKVPGTRLNQHDDAVRLPNHAEAEGSDSVDAIALLFDIDGTLIDSGGAGGGALLQALKSEFGISDAAPVPLHGRTDLGIMTELLESHGVSATAESRERLAQHYFAKLPAVLQERNGRTLPGVEPLLQRFSSQQQCHLGILTGNMPTSAQTKLEHFDLWHYFSFGVFGDQAALRPDLSRPALETVRRHVGNETVARQIVIIGDTPLDVELARVMGARCLAVCTGGFSAAELTAAGCDHCVDDLQETEFILEWCLTVGKEV